VILRLAVLIQYRSVTDTQTDRQTHRHTTTEYTALSKASRGKNLVSFRHVTLQFTRLECVQKASVSNVKWSYIRFNCEEPSLTRSALSAVPVPW